MRSDLFNLYICTRDLQREKEIAHYEQPEELKDDLTALNAKVALLTAKLAKRGEKASRSRKDDGSKTKSKKHHSSKKSTAKKEQKFEVVRRKDHKKSGSTQNYKVKKCHHCGKPGHIKLECFILHPDKKKKGKKKPHTHDKTQKVPGSKYTKSSKETKGEGVSGLPV